MTTRQRCAGLALVGVLAGLSALLLSFEGARLWAGPGPLPARTVQFSPSPEPPLLGSAPAPPASTPTPPPAAEPGLVQDPPVPVVALRVRVPANAAPGHEIEYHICVENLSQAPAHHVLVRNPLPANARFVRADPEPTAREPELQWQLGTLAACACKKITLVLAPTGSGDVQDCARVQFEHGQCVLTRITHPSISLRKGGPTQAILYDALNYQLTVTNTGSGEATGVALSDTLAAGLEHASGKNPLTWDVGTLAPGQSRTVEYQVVAKTTGKLCNHATATAAGDLHQDADSCVTITEAKMALTKKGPAQQYIDQAADYQITVTNTGSAPLTNVQITDPVPAQMTFVSANNRGQLAGNQVQWFVGTLEPGASRTVDVLLKAQAAGRICNRATAAADRGVTAQAEFCTEFSGVSGLLIEVADTDDPVEVGADTSYIITILNQGRIPVTNLAIVAEVPAQMAVTRATGPSDNRKEGQKLIFQPMTLQPKAEARFVVYVKALQAGDVRFKVDMAADQLPSGTVHREESTTIYKDIPNTRPQPPAGVPQGRPRGGS